MKLLYGAALIHAHTSPQGGTPVPAIGYEPEYVTMWFITLLAPLLIGLAIAHAIVSHAKAAKILGIIVSLMRDCSLHADAINRFVTDATHVRTVQCNSILFPVMYGLCHTSLNASVTVIVI